MNLAAYAQIPTLSDVMKSNGIEVPRLRGLALMRDQEPYTKEEIEECMKDIEVDALKDLLRSEPFFNPNSCCHSYDSWTDYLVDFYTIKSSEPSEFGNYKEIGVRWDKIHGWKRRILKFEIKKQKRRILNKIAAWNRYAGRDDVLYIHARIGGWNWNDYGGPELTRQSWFLEKVDDSWDSTYCDIFAKIEPVSEIREE